MKNLVDKNGRTIWFYGSPGKLKPANAKSRFSKMPNRKKLTKDTEKQNADDKSIKQELSDTLDTERNTTSTNNKNSLKSKVAKKPTRKRKQSK